MLQKILNKIKWKKGRQNSTYNKKLLFQSKKFKFDIWLLYYNKGSFIATHLDEVPKKFQRYYEDRKHYRINMTLVKAKIGGKFITRDSIFKFGRIVLFRPDINPHSVTMVKRGYRLVLSIGWLI